MSEIWLIRSTFAKKDEAISVAQILLEEKLVACANIEAEHIAIYKWEGMIQQENEASLIVKTTKTNVHQAIARIKHLHTYQIPSIVAWPAPVADESFSSWVKSEVEAPL